MIRSRKWIGAGLIAAAAAGLVFAGLQIRALLAQPTAEPAAAIKILVEQEGIYALTATDLLQFGWEDVDPALLRMEHAGETYPLHVEGEGRQLRVLFYGGPPEGEAARYTPANAYFLYRDGSPELTLRAEPSSAPGSDASIGSVPVVLHLEENTLYNPKLMEGRPWFWSLLPAPGEQSLEFSLPGLASGPAMIQLDWFGSTEAEGVDPDHHLRIYLNEELVADESWDGAGPHEISVEIQDGLLRPGENQLAFEAPGDTGVAADLVLLDSVEITYQRSTEAEGAVIFEAAAGPVRFPKGTRLFQPGQAGEALVILEDSEVFPTVQGRRYIAVDSDTYSTPNALQPANTGPDLRGGAGARYIAIGAPELLAALEPLLEQRDSQGLSTLAVPVQAVYDQFGSGLATPHAVRDFLRYAAENWAVPPEYVLLVGDWSYDPYGYISERVTNGVPSFLIYTEFGGETVSDVEIAKLDADGLPDLALGRFPARTQEQVQILVEKTLAFENRLPPGAWTDRVLAIADGTERSFTLDAENYLAGFDSSYSQVLLSPETGTGEAASAEIEGLLKEGVLLMSYFGHGSISQLGKDALFTAEQAAVLRNGNLTPIMVNITCLVGLFTHPSVVSLSEAMLLNPDGGAVASLGASSLTLPVFQAYLSEAFVGELVARQGGSLGDVLLAAQRQVPIDMGSSSIEVLDTFLLFGDPALLIP